MWGSLEVKGGISELWGSLDVKEGLLWVVGSLEMKGNFQERWCSLGVKRASLRCEDPLRWREGSLGCGASSRVHGGLL